MSDEKNKKTDEGLQGNEKIESAVAALQKEPSEEMLAHTLTVIRRRMNEKGQLILAVEPPAGGGQFLVQAVTTEDGQTWWTAFTSFEEEVKRLRKRDVNIFKRHGGALYGSSFRKWDKRRDHQSMEPDDHAG